MAQQLGHAYRVWSRTAEEYLLAQRPDQQRQAPLAHYLHQRAPPRTHCANCDDDKGRGQAPRFVLKSLVPRQHFSSTSQQKDVQILIWAARQQHRTFLHRLRAKGKAPKQLREHFTQALELAERIRPYQLSLTDEVDEARHHASATVELIHRTGDDLAISQV